VIVLEWTTHMLSGIVAGYTVTGGDWKGGVVGGVAGLIPDLDEHRSRIGKLVFPLSFIINKTVGHRTLTHSLLFVVGIGLILMPFFDSWVWLATIAGILAHIAGDMLTGRVALLYPSNKSIGISISPLGFKLIDRLTAMLLIAMITFEGYTFFFG